MLNKDELYDLIKKHFNILKKRNELNLKAEDEDKLIAYFSNLIYNMQFYNNLDVSLKNNGILNNDDFIIQLIACTNAAI